MGQGLELANVVFVSGTVTPFSKRCTQTHEPLSATNARICVHYCICMGEDEGVHSGPADTPSFLPFLQTGALDTGTAWVTHTSIIIFSYNL